jgi:hypothetical protein
MVLSVQDVVRGMSLPPGYNHEALEQLANMADAYEVEIERLRTMVQDQARWQPVAASYRDERDAALRALELALALCKWCDGTGTVAMADVETGEQIGAKNCEHCWPLRSDSATDSKG